MRSYELDLKAVKQAKLALCIFLPVAIRFGAINDFKPGVIGDHRTVVYPDGQVKHLVRLKETLVLEQASEMLWHELTHCAQYERYVEETGATDFHAFYVGAAKGSLGAEYLHNTMEIEARRVAYHYTNIVPTLLLKETDDER